MADTWAKRQREGWLCSLYGRDDGNGSKQLPPNSVQWKLVGAFQSMLSFVISPRDCAAMVASLIISERNITTACNNMLGMLFAAAEQIQDQAILQTLVDFLVALANLPDAVDKTGEVIVFDDEKLWIDLPGFNMNLTERFQGTEQYLYRSSPRISRQDATTAWTNINTFFALLARDSGAQKIPALANKTQLGVRALTMALEHPSDTPRGSNYELCLPAARQWLMLAGDHIERLCDRETAPGYGGSLWRDKAGSDICNRARLQFWKDRLADLGE